MFSYFQNYNIAKQLSYGVTLAGILQLLFLIYFSKNFYKPKFKANLIISFVMKKKIGNAVKRNKIRRKLKAIVNKLLKKRGAINRDYTYIVFGKSKAYAKKQIILMPEMIKCFKKLSK